MALAEQTTYPSWGYMIFNTIEPAPSSLWELWDSPTQASKQEKKKKNKKKKKDKICAE